MSRAINVDASVAQVTDMCAKHNALISIVEPLKSGGTRLVLRTAHDAAVISKAYGNKVINSTVVRFPTRMRTA